MKNIAPAIISAVLAFGAINDANAGNDKKGGGHSPQPQPQQPAGDVIIGIGGDRTNIVANPSANAGAHAGANAGANAQTGPVTATGGTGIGGEQQQQQQQTTTIGPQSQTTTVGPQTTTVGVETGPVSATGGAGGTGIGGEAQASAGIENSGNSNSGGNQLTGGDVNIGGDNFESFSFGATNGVSSAVLAAAGECNRILNNGKAFNVGTMGAAFGFANSKGEQLPADTVCKYVATVLQNWLNANEHARRMFEQNQRFQFEYMVLGLKHWLNYPATRSNGEGQAPANLNEEHNGFAKSFLIQNVDGLRTNFMARMLAIRALEQNGEPDNGNNPLYYQRVMEVVLLGIPEKGVEPTIALATAMDPLKDSFSQYMASQREIVFPDAVEFMNNVREAERIMSAEPGPTQ